MGLGQVVVGLGFLSGLLIASCDSVVIEKHAALVEADRPFARGWLPDIVPIGSTDVIMHNDLDINISWGSFVMPQAEIASFVSLLEHRGGQDYHYSSGPRVWVFTIDETTGQVDYRLGSAKG